MTDILSMINKSKEVVSLAAHPISQAELEMKMHYFNGLALLMNVDAEMHDKEKDYIAAMLKAADFDDDKLKELEKFAESPDSDKVTELISEIKKTPEIRNMFMVDIMLLAEKDGEFHEKEKEFIENMFEAFHYPKKEKALLKELVDILKTENEAKSIAFYNGHKETYDTFSWLFPIHGLKPEEALSELKENFHFNFVRWEFDYGKILNDNNQIADYPVTNLQFTTFLNNVFKSDSFKKNAEETKFFNGEDIIIDLDKSEIEFSNSLFSCEQEKLSNPVTGISPLGAEHFVTWVNNINENNAIDIVRLNVKARISALYSFPKTGEDGDKDIKFKKSCPGKPTMPEIFFHKQYNRYHYYVPGNFDGNANSLTKNATLEPHTVRDDLTFRVMKKSGEENE
ncbi:MAG: TerB family tellurite resistance protein [bacterium]